MKTMEVWSRTILERTGFKKYPYKKVTQYILTYNGAEVRNGHYEDYNNKRLKKRFNCVLSTRNKERVKNFYTSLTNKEADKWLKEQISCIVHANNIWEGLK